jgi:hypothetical protein
LQRLILFNRREIENEFIDSLSGFNIIKKKRDRHSCSEEYRDATHGFTINTDQLITFLFHNGKYSDFFSFCNGPGKAGGTLKDMLLPDGFHSYQQGLLYLNTTWSFTTGFAAGSMYWTSTLSGGRAVARGINEMNLSVSLYESSRGNALSARCLKD